jgi:hypothetical protein
LFCQGPSKMLNLWQGSQNDASSVICECKLGVNQVSIGAVSMDIMIGYVREV